MLELELNLGREPSVLMFRTLVGMLEHIHVIMRYINRNRFRTLVGMLELQIRPSMAIAILSFEPL